MLRSLVLAVVVAVVVVVSASPAGACPPGPCLKYRHMQQQPPPEQNPRMYTRPLRGALPRFSWRDIARFLTEDAWSPVLELEVPNARISHKRLRFVFANTVIRTPDLSTRVVLVRRIEQIARTIYVDVDGSVFMLSRCGTARAPAMCLTQHDEIDLDAPPSVDDSDNRFAKPPGQ